MTTTATRPLIVNADDYGLTEKVSSGILRAHRDGIVTSTSVLTLAPGFAKTATWLTDYPGLGVGVHLAAVGEDPPLLSAREVPTLVGRKGKLALSWRHFLPRAAAGRIDPADLRREFTAQIQAVTSVGLAVSHLDSHQHLHLWPSVGAVVLDLAVSQGVPAVRVPRSHRLPLAPGINQLARRLARNAGALGILTPADASGVDEAGGWQYSDFCRALNGFAQRGAASAELGTHPGEPDDPDRSRYRWGYHWDDELTLLTSAEARRAVADRGFVLANYAVLGSDGSSSSSKLIG
ncbi:MAG: ChbG/HpnK family deacetylase [Actinomycetota bacterium]|nr:ChbG/HpnK family deacetylase [Actinomycetota bacterium]